MTPTGVEHQMAAKQVAKAVQVNRSLTPTGVEH